MSNPCDSPLYLAHSEGSVLSCSFCMNPRFDNNETQVNWEQMPLDVAAGVNFLKNSRELLSPTVMIPGFWGAKLDYSPFFVIMAATEICMEG